MFSRDILLEKFQTFRPAAFDHIIAQFLPASEDSVKLLVTESYAVIVSNGASIIYLTDIGPHTGAQAQDAPTTIYWMRYANVLLDYAECCFRTWDEATGWDFLDRLRERAFGNLEVGPDLSKYLTSYMKENGHTEYPIDFSNEVVFFPSAKDYYKEFKVIKGFKSEAWMVALNMERVKEFSGEPCLRAALQCSGFLEDYINTVYPKNTLEPSDLSCPWVKRNFDYNGEAWEKGVPVPVITNTF